MARSIWREVTRKIHYARFRLLDSKRYNSLVLEEILGKPFLVIPGVFNPALFWSSELLVKAMLASSLGPETSVLDLGTGSGIAGVFAAASGSSVVSVDINPDAIRCARLNALLNGVEAQMEILEGDLFTPVRGRKFDLIVFNPPYLQGEPKSRLDFAFFSPDILPRFLAQSTRYLLPGGSILIVTSSDSDMATFQRTICHNQLIGSVVLQKKVLGETLEVHQLFPLKDPAEIAC